MAELKGQFTNQLTNHIQPYIYRSEAEATAIFLPGPITPCEPSFTSIGTEVWPPIPDRDEKMH